MTGPAQERELRRLRQMLRHGWRFLAVSLVSTFVAAAASMLYANHTARESERKWCGIVSTMDDAYRATPPQTPAGRKLAADIRHLRVDFGCP
jgi:hypothetical protein